MDAPSCVERHFGAAARRVEDRWQLPAESPWSRADDVARWWKEFHDEGWTLFAGAMNDETGLFAVPACSAGELVSRVGVGSHNATNSELRVRRVARLLDRVAEQTPVRILCADAAGLRADLEQELDAPAAVAIAKTVFEVCPEAIGVMMDELEAAGLSVEQRVAAEIERLEDEGVWVDDLSPDQRPSSIDAAFDLYLRSLRRLRLWWD